jgi:hypothetical protein
VGDPSPGTTRTPVKHFGALPNRQLGTVPCMPEASRPAGPAVSPYAFWLFGSG